MSEEAIKQHDSKLLEQDGSLSTGERVTDKKPKPPLQTASEETLRSVLVATLSDLRRDRSCHDASSVCGTETFSHCRADNQARVYVAYPHQAQSTISKSQLVATSMAILNPAPTSFNLELSDMFLTNSSLKSHLDPFLASLSLTESSPAFVKFQVPAIEASNGSQTHIAQRVQIANLDEWDKYSEAVLASEEYNIYLKGRGGLKYGSLPKNHSELRQKGYCER